jgi:hypothetical protein
LGGGATQFSIDAGQPNLSERVIDVGVFAGDEWQVRSNITLDLGLPAEVLAALVRGRFCVPASVFSTLASRCRTS